MKAVLSVVVAAVAGVAVGWSLTQREFASEALPVDLEASGPAVPREAAPIGPKITVVNGERHDFGTMDRGSHGRHAFLIRNDGDAPLTLATGQPSCSVCIKVFRATKERLEPGEKVVLQVRRHWIAFFVKNTPAILLFLVALALYGLSGWAAGFAPGQLQPLERLGRRHFVDELAVDIQQRGAVRFRANDVGVPNLLEQGSGCHARSSSTDLR